MRLDKLRQGARWVLFTRSSSAFVVTTPSNLVSFAAITNNSREGDYNQSAPVKDKIGWTREHIKQATKCVKHYQELLNYSEPDEPANPQPADDVLEIYTSSPTHAEVLLELPSKPWRVAKILALIPSMLRCWKLILIDQQNSDWPHHDYLRGVNRGT